MQDVNSLKRINEKMQQWSKASIVENLKVIGKNEWQNSGKYKNYFWKRLYREDDSGRVFFNLLFTKEGLILKLDCLRTSKSKVTGLDKLELHTFDTYIQSKGIKGIVIKKEEITSYNWSSLVSVTQNFIIQHWDAFDELENMFAE